MVVRFREKIREDQKNCLIIQLLLFELAKPSLRLFVKIHNFQRELGMRSFHTVLTTVS